MSVNYLKVKSVSYRYSDAAKDEYVLKNINYEFEKGKIFMEIILIF